MIITVSKTLILNEEDFPDEAATRIAKAIAGGYAIVVHSADGREKDVWRRVQALVRDGIPDSAGGTGYGVVAQRDRSTKVDEPISRSADEGRAAEAVDEEKGSGRGGGGKGARRKR